MNCCSNKVSFKQTSFVTISLVRAFISHIPVLRKMKLVTQQMKTGPSDYVVKFLNLITFIITEHAMAVDTLVKLYILITK